MVQQLSLDLVDYKGDFPRVPSGRPKRTGSGQFKWKAPTPTDAYIFPATTLQIPALWPTGAGELSGSDHGEQDHSSQNEF